jgi:hypothetical protein
LYKAALFVCPESDTFLKNYTISDIEREIKSLKGGSNKTTANSSNKGGSKQHQ